MDIPKQMSFSDSLIELAGLEKQHLPERTLYIVGVPIGNMGDITLRALWTLSRSDLIAAEDTREARKLLDRFGIKAPVIKINEHNEREGAQQLSKVLDENKRVALITDAGTPCVSDPGAKVVAVLRQEGYNIMPVPGPSAVVTALSAAGLEGQGFSFVGFVPPNAKARQNQLSYWLGRPEPFVLYEAPHRILDLMKDLGQMASADRHVVVAREITKKFEMFQSMKASEIAQWIQTHEPRGEYVILIDHEPKQQEIALTEEQKQWLAQLRDLLPASKLSAAAAKVTGIPRSDIYRYLCDNEDTQA